MKSCWQVAVTRTRVVQAEWPVISAALVCTASPAPTAAGDLSNYQLSRGRPQAKSHITLAAVSTSAKREQLRSSQWCSSNITSHTFTQVSRSEAFPVVFLKQQHATIDNNKCPGFLSQKINEWMQTHTHKQANLNNVLKKNQNVTSSIHLQG